MPRPDHVLLALRGLQTPPTGVGSTRRLAPSPFHSAIRPDPTPSHCGGAQPLLAPSLPTQHQCGWPGVGWFSQFHPRIHTCLLTHLSLLCKWKIAPEQDVGPLLGVTTRCGTVALLAVHIGVPVHP